MTFTEAAVEVLRLVGKPLHYKKITEIAIDRNLLSHVGKTPEITMSSRLATMVKKDRGDAPILKVKPGVFGLREFTDAVLKKAEKESGHEYELPPEDSADEKRRPGATRAADKSAADDTAAAEAGADEAGAEGGDEARAESKKLPGQDVFAEEDDDDEPILAKLDTDRKKGGGRREAKDDEGDDEDGKGRRKRRRRRRRKGGNDDDEGGRGSGKDGGRGSGKDGGRGSRKNDRGSSRDDRRRGGSRQSNKVSGDWDREPGEGEVLGHDLADAVREVLDTGKGQRALDYRKLAELLVNKKKLSGDPSALAPTVAAAVRADGARRTVAGLRPRFRETGSEVELLEWALPHEAHRAEQDAMKSAARQRDLARRAFLRRVAELPMAGLAELLATWLNAEGVVQLRAIRRPSATGNAFHLAGLLRRGFEETRLAIVVYRDGTDLGREHVMEVRGALHHYDNASAAWLVSTGQVLSGAKDEASAAGREPCGLFDGAELAKAMERVGVGLTRYTIPIVALDLDLLDALGRGQGKPARDKDRERERDRRKEREEREDAESTDESRDEESGDDEESSDDEERGRGRRRRGRGGRGRRGRRDEAEAEASDESDESEDEETSDESVVETEEGPDEADVTVDDSADADVDDTDDDSDDDESDEDESDDDTDEADSDDDTNDDDSDDDEDSDDEDSDDDDRPRRPRADTSGDDEE